MHANVSLDVGWWKAASTGEKKKKVFGRFAVFQVGGEKRKNLSEPV